jgi:branched-chain amino acid transport system ATP-binding protein
MSLNAAELTKVFGGLRAVDGFSINVDAGEIVGLIGPNGAGKTTSFNLLTGQIRPTSGVVTLDGKDITGLPPWTLSRMGIARTFQHAASFASLSVADNLALAYASHGTLPKRERADKAVELLATVAPDAPMHGLLQDQPYGVQRRLGIAIALANDPRFLLLDEPAAGLNPAETTVLGQLIQATAHNGVGVLLVEHDLELVGRIVHRLEVMSAGKPLFSGTAKDALNDPGVLEAYIGRGGRKDA